MMRVWFLSILTFLSFSSAALHANEYIVVEDAYALATAPSQKNGAVFASFKNLGKEHLSGKDIAILSAESAVSERVELHTHTMQDGIMMMREVPSFAVPADETLHLKPAGDHIMLFDLKAPLVPGESFPVTVTIGDGYHHGYGEITFDVKIVSPGDAP